MVQLTVKVKDTQLRKNMEKLTHEEIEGLKTVGIIAENWHAVIYPNARVPVAIFREESDAVAYRDQFTATSLIETWPMKIRDIGKTLSPNTKEQ